MTFGILIFVEVTVLDGNLRLAVAVSEVILLAGSRTLLSSSNPSNSGSPKILSSSAPILYHGECNTLNQKSQPTVGVSVQRTQYLRERSMCCHRLPNRALTKYEHENMAPASNFGERPSTL
jgi:hypothetical protein